MKSKKSILNSILCVFENIWDINNNYLLQLKKTTKEMLKEQI